MATSRQEHVDPVSPGTRIPGKPRLQRAKTTLKIAVSAAFFVYIFHIVDGKEFYHALKEIRPGYYMVSLIILIANSFILAFKFKTLLTPSGIDQTLLSLVKINFISRFYALLLTTAVGQGAVRWYQTTKHQKDKLNFLPVLIIERASFLFTLCLFMVVSSIFLADTNSREVGSRLLPFAAAGLSVLPGLYLVFALSIKFGLPEDRRARPAKSAGSRLSAVFRSFSLFRNQSGPILGSTLLAFIWHLTYLLRVFFLFSAVGVSTDLSHLCWMASLVLLIQILPVSVNGIGLREGLYAYLFGLAGMPVEKGVLIGTLFFSQMLIASAIGGIIVLCLKK